MEPITQFEPEQSLNVSLKKFELLKQQKFEITLVIDIFTSLFLDYNEV